MSSRTSRLVLGWRVDSAGNPIYWLDPAAKPGAHTPKHLVTVPAADAAAHTVIVAQSGSGKSAFLGRLLEELLLRTGARCLILDPNADFARIHEADRSLWQSVKYDAVRGMGRLPTEATSAEFESRWSNLTFRTLTNRPAHTLRPPFAPIDLWWPSLSVELFAEELGPLHRSEMYHAHAFLGAIASLVDLRSAAASANQSLTDINKTDVDPLDTAELILAKRLPPSLGAPSSVLEDHLRLIIDGELSIGRVAASPPPRAARPIYSVFVVPLLLPMLGPLLTAPSETMFEEAWINLVNRTVDRAVAAAAYVSDEIARFYFARVRELKAARVVSTKRQAGPPAKPVHLEVVDLSSLPDRSTRLVTVKTLLDQVWVAARDAWATALTKDQSADTRVPTFVVIDEAHNLVSSAPRGRLDEVVIDGIRTIAAEGRKYGVFLIVVTQRPDKLDPMVVSECENRVLMRINSATVLKETRKLLGLESIPVAELEECLSFKLGRAMLIGRWAPANPIKLYSAARRTVEGGRNLRAEHWAQARVRR